MTATRTDKWIDGVSPGDRTVDVAVRSLSARLAAVRHFLPLAAERAEEDGEYVHQLRVATRRASAALGLYEDFVPRRRAAWVKKQLRRLRRAANEARDCDVLARRLAEDEAGGHARHWLGRVRAERAEAQGPIVALYERLCHEGRFDDRVEGLLWRVRPRRCAATGGAGRFGDWAHQRLRPLVERFFRASPPTGGGERALHRFRIRGKELRYAMELLAGAFAPAFRDNLYPAVETLQDQLGAINDLATAQSRLRQRIGRAGHGPEVRHLRHLLDDQHARLEQARAAFHGWWTPRLRQALRDGFGDALGVPAAGCARPACRATNPHRAPGDVKLATPLPSQNTSHFNGECRETL
jgi:CHAD domain-containing protein